MFNFNKNTSHSNKIMESDPLQLAQGAEIIEVMLKNKFGRGIVSFKCLRKQWPSFFNDTKVGCETEANSTAMGQQGLSLLNFCKQRLIPKAMVNSMLALPTQLNSCKRSLEAERVAPLGKATM